VAAAGNIADLLDRAVVVRIADRASGTSELGVDVVGPARSVQADIASRIADRFRMSTERSIAGIFPGGASGPASQEDQIAWWAP
jgi:hypothetical protein